MTARIEDRTDPPESPARLRLASPLSYV